MSLLLTFMTSSIDGWTFFTACVLVVTTACTNMFSTWIPVLRSTSSRSELVPSWLLRDLLRLETALTCTRSSRLQSLVILYGFILPHQLFGLFKVSSESIWSRLDNAAFRIPTTIRSQTISSVKSPYSHVSTRKYSSVINCSTESSNCWCLQLKFACLKIKVRYMFYLSHYLQLEVNTRMYLRKAFTLQVDSCHILDPLKRFV